MRNSEFRIQKVPFVQIVQIVHFVRFDTFRAVCASNENVRSDNLVLVVGL